MSTNPEAILTELGVSVEAIRARGLTPFSDRVELVPAELGADGREHRLTAEAARAWQAMRSEARAGAVEIFIVSAFRSVRRQREIFEAKLAAGQRLDDILSVSAPPGYSEHHTGRAVDVGTPQCRPLEIEFAESAAFTWLQDNADRFGYRLSYPPGNADGYQYEPWHWCYGRDEQGETTSMSQSSRCA